MKKATATKSIPTDYVPAGDYTPADIKWALVALAKSGQKANRNEALRYLDECQFGTQEYNEAIAEGEARAEFMSSWVHGGGHREDAAFAYMLLGR